MTPELILQWANECNVPTDWRAKNLVAFAALVEAHVRADERAKTMKVLDELVEHYRLSYATEALCTTQYIKSQINERSKP